MPLNAISRSTTADTQPAMSTHLKHALERFPRGRVHDMRRLVAATGAAMLVDYERDEVVSGTWYSDNLHFFDMTLTRRPTGARGYFEEAADRARPVGSIFFAPSGFHYRGEGGKGRQKSLSLFLARGEDDGLLDAVALGLEDCISLESDNVRSLLLRIAREVADPGFASELLLEGLLLSLLVETMRVLRGRGERRVRKGGLAPADMRTIAARVAAEVPPPSLAELAALCRMSPRQLVRAFREETGGTIGGYVRDATMDRARRLLADTKMPIGEVASQLGFSRPPAFSSAFRRASGWSPRDYRFNRNGAAR